MLDASGVASTAAERRKASGPRWGRFRARASSGGNIRPCGADNGWMRLSALRLPSILGGDVLRVVFCKARAQQRVARTLLFALSPPRGERRRRPSAAVVAQERDAKHRYVAQQSG
jgi:hypothetical protein